MLGNKIKDNSGATILLALLFFLLCSVAGVIVLTAGSAASGRISGLTRENQAYYSVSSSAQMIKGEIQNNGFQYSQEYADNNGTISREYPELPKGVLSEMLSDGSKAIFGGDISYTDKFTIEPEGQDAKEALGQVSGTLTMDKDYNITITLQLNLDQDKYQCTVTAKALTDKTLSDYTKDVNGAQTVFHKTLIKTIWSDCMIEKG